MKLTATIVAISVAAAAAFSPCSTFVRSSNLQAVPGFTGFGHVTGEVTAPSPPPAVASSTSTCGVPGFSGFSHFSGQMGGNPSLGRSFVAPSPAPAAPAPAPAKPIFSGFGHATGQMGGNPSIITRRR